MTTDHEMLALCDADNAVLLVIDLQGKIFEMAFNAEHLRRLAPRVLRLAELFQVPVVLAEQYPQGLGSTIPAVREVYDGLRTEKHELAKTSFGCCGEPGFDALLAGVAEQVRQRRSGGERPVDVVVIGIESHVCVQQTVLALLRQPYRVVVLEDCIGGRVRAHHQQAVERFRRGGALLTNFESLAFEWTRSKDHPRFKQMSALVKEGAS